VLILEATGKWENEVWDGGLEMSLEMYVLLIETDVLGIDRWTR
jgi:hypothetical protein